jgi:hypothetical protein
MVTTIVVSMVLFGEPVERYLLRHADNTHGRRQRRLRQGNASLFTPIRTARSARDAPPPRSARGLRDRQVGIRPRRAVGVISNFRPRPACCGAGEAALHRDARERAPPGLNRGRRGGQIGSFLGFRGNGSLAVLAVLAYRMISYWRPTVPGVIA